MDRNRASRLRQMIADLRVERTRIEERLLRRRHMLRASLIERYLGTSEQKRTTPAYYLSFLHEGKTILKYVRQGRLLTIEPKTRAWSEYGRLLAEWVKITRRLEATWRALGKAQSDKATVRDTLDK
jgi:hypothetical protein